MHRGICGMYFVAKYMDVWVLKVEYYWPTPRKYATSTS